MTKTDRIINLSVLFSVLFSLAALLSYFSQFRVLGSLGTSYIPMAPSTAISFLLCAFAIVVKRKNLSRGINISIYFPIIFVGLFGLAKFIENLSGITVSFETYFVKFSDSLNGIPVGIMSHSTGIVFFLESLAIFFLVFFPSNKKLKNISGFIALVIVLLASVYILGYVYKEPFLYGQKNIVPMALSTAISFMLQGLAILFSLPSYCFPMDYFMGRSTRSRLLRAFLPLLFLAIFLDDVVMNILLTFGSSSVPMNKSLTSVILLVILFYIVNHTSTAMGKLLDKTLLDLRAANDSFKNEIAKRRVSEQKFLNLFISTHDAIMMLAPPDWNFIDANPATLKMFRANDIGEFCACNPGNVSPEHQPSGELSSDLAKKYILEAMKTGKASFEWMHKTLDGKLFPATVLLSRVEIGGEAVLQATVRDISMEKENLQMERKLSQANKMESIGTLASGIAHEINSPVQFVYTNVSFIRKAMKSILEAMDSMIDLCSKSLNFKDQTAIDKELLAIKSKYKVDFLKDEVVSSMDNSSEGINRVTTIVNALKNYSRIGSEVMQKEDINEAIDGSVLVSRHEWKYYADVETNLGADVSNAYCFIGDIKQVIINMVVNAAHSIEEKIKEGVYEKGLINISTYAEGGQFVIKICDNGNGIPKPIQEKIYDPFFTTKEVGKGTGQGLSLVYSVIVDKHKGSINFETEQGKGTTFYISIPIDGTE